MRVLIADDTEDIRMLLRLTLAKDGRFHIVGEARDGREAIEIAEAERPDAIVLDLAMPVMDGLQALPHLRRIVPRSRIIVLSGFNASQMADEALTLGADAYLEKGSAFSKLVDLLDAPANTSGVPACGPAATRAPAPTIENLAREAVAATTAGSTLDGAFAAFCAVAARGFRFERASFWVVADEGTCVCEAVCDTLHGRLVRGSRLRLAGRGRRILTGNPVLEPNTAEEPDGTTNDVLRHHDIRSYLGIPLVIAGETKAFISFSSSKPFAFSGEDIPGAMALVRDVASTFHLLYLLEHERDARSRLQQTEDLRSDLVEIVAHDLRSPMTVIGGYAQHMRDSWTTLPEPDKLRFLDAITRNVDDVAKLVEDMLEVASIEAGRLHCDVQPFDLAEVVRATVAELAANAGRTCGMTMPSDLPRALGDARRQRQILANLISNAIKFSPPSEPVDVVVELRGGAADVSVRDHGDGITAEHLPMIFEKFYRVRDAGAPKASGNGLGLYICRLLVEAQGGRIWADSTPGEGSTFTYTVRVTGANATAAA